MKRGNALAAALAAVVLGVVAAGAAGAGASPTRAAAKQDDVTITLSYVNTVQNAWVRTIQDFEHKYPNIKVKATFLEGAANTALLATQLQAGNAPDIFTINAGTGSSNSIEALAPAGKLLDLTGSPWVSRIPLGGLQYFSNKNKVYGWPMAVSTNGVFYNTDIFKQLKLKVPTTLKDFYALCPKVKAAGKIPIALGFAGSQVGVNVMLLQMTNQFVFGQDKNWVAKRIANKVTFASSPLWRALLQSIVDMNKNGCFNDNPAGTSYPAGAGSLVATGQAAMEFLSGGTINGVTSINPNINYQMFQLPPDNSGKHTVASIGFSLSVGANAATKHPEEVRKFLNYAADANVDYTWATNAGSIAPLNAKKGLFPAYYAASAKPLAKAGRLSLNQNIQIPNPGFFASLQNTVIGLFTGQLNVNSALADLDNKWPTP